MAQMQEFDVEGIKFTIDVSQATTAVKGLVSDIERLDVRYRDLFGRDALHGLRGWFANAAVSGLLPVYGTLR